MSHRYSSDRKQSPTGFRKGKKKRSTSVSFVAPGKKKSSGVGFEGRSKKRSEGGSFEARGERRSFGRGSTGQKSFGPQRYGRSGGGGRNKSQKGPKIAISRYISDPVTQDNQEEYKNENQFNTFKYDERIKTNVAKRNYDKPTPIQDKSIPHILDGRDIVGIANTGTGKTAAFLLPLMHKVLQDKRQNVIILAPTRELAQQINQEFMAFGRGLKIFSVLCIGGASIGTQIRTIRLPHNFLIGTPGRIKDLINRGVIDMRRFNNVVIDEADRMLDMGFIHEIKLLLSQLPAERQSLFFSATISNEIELLIKTFLRNPITVSVKQRDTSANVKQNIVRIGTGKKRIDMLDELLNNPEFKKVLVFGRTKHGVEKITETLERRGHKVTSLHGNKSQGQRLRALRSFKENQVRVLIATDVAARGLDIDNVTHVINFDPPSTYDDYVHRIGRTGRADKTGVALTFVD